MLRFLRSRMYVSSCFFYWFRYIRADQGRLIFGGRHYRDDFWYRLNRGWHEIDLEPAN